MSNPPEKLVSIFKCRLCNEVIESSPLHIDWYTVQDLAADAHDNLTLVHRCNEGGPYGVADLVGAIPKSLADDYFKEDEKSE